MNSPSRVVMRSCRFTKRIGSMPTRRVSIPLMSSGENAESKPYRAETIIDININPASTSNARPIFFVMALKFILPRTACGPTCGLL